MEKLYEQIIMSYVTNGGQRFVCPQYLVSNGYWHCEPDFVAIDLREKTLYVIEVTTSSNVSDLVRRLGENVPVVARVLRNNLQNMNIDFSSWPIKFRAFVRKAAVTTFNTQIDSLHTGEFDIKAIDLEGVLANWTWWDKAGGPVNSLDPG